MSSDDVIDYINSSFAPELDEVGGGNSSANEWDKNGDNKLSKREADSWFLYKKGQPITVDNASIDWTGLKMPADTDFGGTFQIQTHTAFKDLPLETAMTYGGTSFIRTGWLTAEVQNQLYHYDLRPNNSMRNIIRNIMNEAGKPGQQNYTREGSAPNTGTPFMIHYLNPTITFTIR